MPDNATNISHTKVDTEMPQTTQQCESTTTSAGERTEKKNRICKWFFAPKKIADTKTLFDSLRNMGICVAMLLGLESFYSASETFPNWAQWSIGLFVIVASILLALANAIWTFVTLEERSSLAANIASLLIGACVIAAFAINAFTSLPSV